ncbi:MAG: serine hydrolase [Chitinophagaceae bacterium]|nr:serine hydrolase [Chitinophagaceae bacterium]
MKISFFITIIPVIMLSTHCSPLGNKAITSQAARSNKLVSLLESHPQYFDSLLRSKKDRNIQIIYTQIDRTSTGSAQFIDYYFNVANDQYFYPASTVKFPIAVLALQRLRELNVAGLDMNSTMLTDAIDEEMPGASVDSTASEGKPSIAHYIKKILLVSDNDAFNRLYEFLGQEYINDQLHRMGYKEAQILHRLSVSLTEQQHRHTNPVKFYDSTGKLLYEKPAQVSGMVYSLRNTKLGTGFMRGNVLVNEPFDFSKKNRLPLPDLHHMIRSVMFPDDVPPGQRFKLSESDYVFLRQYMSMLPGESKSPLYNASGYRDNYVKYFMYGNDSVSMRKGLRTFNKTGTAYGFLLDASYIIDHDSGIEFMVSAVISCNSDGIYNDDKYEYDSVGYPFFKHLGQVIYEYELTRKKARGNRQEARGKRQ